MEEFRQTYLSLCKEEGVLPQDSLMDHLQQDGGAAILDLRGHNLPIDTCTVLAKAFQTDTFFTKVILSDCMLSERGVKEILTGLSSNKTVKVLDLKGNNLTSTGAEALGTFLTQNTTLQRLVLEWNALGMLEESFALFCSGLAANTGLMQLDLRNNQINHRGVSELASAIKCNSTLEVLDLRWNNIGLLGGRTLLEALKRNNNIVHLQLTGNNMPREILTSLQQATEHNAQRRSTLRESRNKTLVLSKEIRSLKEEKGQQVLSLMETIKNQKDELGKSNRSTSIEISKLQGALNERMSTVSSLTDKLRIVNAALTLSEQKNHDLYGELKRVKAEKEEQMVKQNRERKRLQEDSTLKEEKLLREIQNLTEANGLLKYKLEEMERRCKVQQQQIFELKHDLSNSTAELKLQAAQAGDRLIVEKQRFKQALEEMDDLHQKEVKHVNQRLEETEKALEESIFKMKRQRVQLEEELSKAKSAGVAERTRSEEERGRVQAQRCMEKEHVTALEEKFQSVETSLKETQEYCSQQKQTISDLLATKGQQGIEVDRLQRRIEVLQQELLSKDQERMAEVSTVRMEKQEELRHLQTEQVGLLEKISTLEREYKVLSTNHNETLQDKERQISSFLEKLQLKEAEIQRMREEEAHRASQLQNAILTYMQGSLKK
ncbi:leucine-rich repeat-containing protein 45 [Gouania willdenowi]|uniref:Leucine rich repeat containing 45 n=1 Tax=Gouania willdenowi TaxID=441366 RepID=A0A8C5EVE8_GOUWI|nr:leucine-rich repeat-containing protein 45 [Gouania willdenowi]